MTNHNVGERWREKAREEWSQEYHKPEGFVVFPNEANLNTDRIADWWIKKVESLLSAQMEEVEKEVKNKINYYEEKVDSFDTGKLDAFREVLALLQSKRGERKQEGRP